LSEPAACGGTVSVALVEVNGRPGGQWSGLLLDEWAEMIPLPMATTGIGCHYDSPGAEAAQVVLVAVPAAFGAACSRDFVAQCIVETMHVAALRGVDAIPGAELGQVGPMAFVADNSGGDAVAISLGGTPSLRSRPPS
jgi:hypothetical protein